MTMNPSENLRQNRWQVAPIVPADLRHQLSHFHPIMLQVLYNRGLTDERHIQAFLDGLYLEAVDPFLLTDMDKAIERISQAVARDENIVVYGDFDADGVTATVLLVEALRGLGLIQHRSGNAESALAYARAEIALRDSEAQNRAFIRAMNLPICGKRA